ncbi:ABC transporter permease [Moorella naiadis]|uniref:ABC transporter permease n=1 Tax=Moorella naiadis (nom. illeg.) TaxID=3093670 RepID=UPI003D9CB638
MSTSMPAAPKSSLNVKGSHQNSLAWLSILSLLVFLLIWYGIVHFGIISKTLLASPAEVLTTFWSKLFNRAPDGATLGAHFKTSLLLALTGYISAVVIGVPLGLLMGWYKKIDDAVKPIFEIIRPIPPIAWIPLAILWFGIGLPAKAFIIWLSAFVPSVINSYAGIKLTEPVLINVARTFGATNWETFLKIGVPSALPMVFTGLRLSLSSAWMTLVAAELLAATQGLGYMIQMGRTLARPDVIIVGMLTIGFTGAAMAYILERFEGKLAPWRRS